MVETTGQCKEGMNIDYKSQWGRHPLVFSLAKPISRVIWTPSRLRWTYS